MTPKSRRCYKLLVRLSSIMGYLKCNLFNFSAQYRYAFNASDAMSQRFYEIFSCSERKKNSKSKASVIIIILQSWKTKQFIRCLSHSHESCSGMRTKMFVYILVYSSFDLMILRDDRSFCSLCDNV